MTLDSRTCPVCGQMDGSRYKTEEARTGLNLPPLHPNCRCTTVPVFDGLDETASLRAARNEEGGYRLVPGDMTFEQWKAGLRNEKQEDIIIPRSVGAKAKNYDVVAPDGNIYQFVEGSRLQNVQVFAGKNGVKPLKTEVAEGLAEQYGGSPENWQHVKANGILDYYGEERAAEIHWFQEALSDE